MRFERRAHRRGCGVALVVIDVAPGERRLIEMPDEHLRRAAAAPRSRRRRTARPPPRRRARAGRAASVRRPRSRASSSEHLRPSRSSAGISTCQPSALLDGGLQRLHGPRLAVHQERRRRRRREAAQPAQDLAADRRAPTSRRSSRWWRRPGSTRPWIFTSVAPSTSCRPRVPSAWKPTNSTVLRGSGSAAREMVQHAAAGRHAARRDDDRRAASRR